ncbi:hypothetical protein [Mycobacterium vicinigordonae]|uniref:Phage capsid protein n=1 Tax=Mycobacterium vicinigordonae TaxID=1719132 RepID=A0A7D6HWW1_9MYCO|nr:hypothetical protein [Mycobacterium vicinigordonae]QLL08853.1 hypothetical protein H0P51_08100 [Mycobacterium vicinigordonae]
MTADTALLPIQFEVPLLPEPPHGLYQVVTWAQDGTEPLRCLGSGIEMRPFNFPGDSGFGQWNAPWCASIDDLTNDDLKTGERPDIDDLEAFEAMTVYGFDHNYCGDLSAAELQDVRDRAARNLARLEQRAVETSVAARLLDDAGTALTANDIVEALGALEAHLAKTQTLGVIHASAQWASPAISRQVLTADGSGTFRTALGHQVVFGGGYVDTLGSTLVASSPVFGWRGPVSPYEAITPTTNQFVALAERSVLVGYESAIAAVEIT